MANGDSNGEWKKEVANFMGRVEAMERARKDHMEIVERNLMQRMDAMDRSRYAAKDESARVMEKLNNRVSAVEVAMAYAKGKLVVAGAAVAAAVSLGLGFVKEHWK